MPDKALGWLVTVEYPGGGTPEVYNVAIANGPDAIDAVRRVLPDPKGAVLKVKSQITKHFYDGLRMKPGDVLKGAQPARKRRSV